MVMQLNVHFTRLQRPCTESQLTFPRSNRVFTLSGSDSERFATGPTQMIHLRPRETDPLEIG